MMESIADNPTTACSFTFDGHEVPFLPGQSVGAALLAASFYSLRIAEDGSPRGLTCGIGICWECRCVLDGRPNTRACVTTARAGMVIRRQIGLE